MIHRPPTLLELQAKDEDEIIKNVNKILSSFSNSQNSQNSNDNNKDNGSCSDDGEQVMQLE